jgi:putative redox protein
MYIKTIDVEYDGGMRFVATSGSGHTFVMDDRESDTGAGPIEAMLGTLAGCSGMDVISILAKKRQTVDSYLIRVRAEQREAYPQVLTRVDVTHELAGPGLDPDAVARAVELSATTYCPVSAMLSAGPTEVRHRHVTRRTEDPAFEATGETVIGPFAWVDGAGG